jgi:integrase/recombinase XerD
VAVLWERYPAVAENDRAREWLQIQAELGLARNTIEAYGRSLEDYFRFTEGRSTDVVSASKSHIAGYVAWLSGGNLQDLVQPRAVQGRALSNATIQLRLTTVRLFYDYLVEEGQRIHSPVGRGRYTPGSPFVRKPPKVGSAGGRCATPSQPAICMLSICMTAEC